MPAVELAGAPELLDIRLPQEIDDYYVLSPFVVRRDGRFETLLRLVNPSDDPSQKISRVHYAASSDGVRFDVGPEVIAPGAREEPDGAGCEDPTVASDGDLFTVFYSGYNAPHERSTMLATTGSSLRSLRKSGSVLPPDDAYANPKEAALVATPRGYRMFFEYARDGASHIGVADAAELGGPWSYAASPIVQRATAFDSWHLSPSSAIRRVDGTHVLFYNGATKNTDWRIGYAVFNEAGTAVLERPQTPLLTTFGLEAGDTDIAFAASAFVAREGDVWIYYSIADRKPYRSRVRIPGAVSDSAFRSD